MLSKAHRLDQASFTVAFTKGRRVHTPGFLLITAPGPVSRLAAVVSKKICRSAVRRNALRRRIYAALRDIGVPPGHTIVIAKQPAAVYTFSDICTELTDGVARLVGFPRQSR